jgi:hypothetical protein
MGGKMVARAPLLSQFYGWLTQSNCIQRSILLLDTREHFCLTTVLFKLQAHYLKSELQKLKVG